METDVETTTNVDELPKSDDPTDEFYALIKNLDYQSIIQLKYFQNNDWHFVITQLNERDVHFCNICEYQMNAKEEIFEHVETDKHKLNLKIAQKLSHPQFKNYTQQKNPPENEIIEISNDSENINEIQDVSTDQTKSLKKCQNKKEPIQIIEVTNLNFAEIGKRDIPNTVEEVIEEQHVAGEDNSSEVIDIPDDGETTLIPQETETVQEMLEPENQTEALSECEQNEDINSIYDSCEPITITSECTAEKDENHEIVDISDDCEETETVLKVQKTTPEITFEKDVSKEQNSNPKLSLHDSSGNKHENEIIDIADDLEITHENANKTKHASETEIDASGSKQTSNEIINLSDDCEEKISMIEDTNKTVALSDCQSKNDAQEILAGDKIHCSTMINMPDVTETSVVLKNISAQEDLNLNEDTDSNQGNNTTSNIDKNLDLEDEMLNEDLVEDSESTSAVEDIIEIRDTNCEISKRDAKAVQILSIEVIDVGMNINQSINKELEKNPLEINSDNEDVIELDLDDEETELQLHKNTNADIYGVELTEEHMEIDENNDNEIETCDHSRKRRSNERNSISSIMDIVEKDEIIEISSSDEENTMIESVKKLKPNSIPSSPLSNSTPTTTTSPNNIIPRNYVHNRIISSNMQNQNQQNNQIVPRVSSPFRKRTNEYKSMGLIGVEYVVKLLNGEHDLLPKYICHLCERIQYNAKFMQDHLMDADHRLHYCQIHFPTAMRHLDEFVESFNEDIRSAIHKYLLQKLAEAIENHHGRSQPFVYMKDEFRKNMTDIRQNLMLIRHASEKNGPTFTHIFDASDPDNIIEDALQNIQNDTGMDIIFEKKIDMRNQRPFNRQQGRFMNQRKYPRQMNTRRRFNRRPFNSQQNNANYTLQIANQNSYRNAITPRSFNEVNQPTNPRYFNEINQPIFSVNNYQSQITSESSVVPTNTGTKPLKSILKRPNMNQNQPTNNSHQNQYFKSMAYSPQVQYNQSLPRPPTGLFAFNKTLPSMNENISMNKSLQQHKSHDGNNQFPRNICSNVPSINTNDLMKEIQMKLQEIYKIKPPNPSLPFDQSSQQRKLMQSPIAIRNTSSPQKIQEGSVALLAATAKKFQKTVKNDYYTGKEDNIDLISILRRIIALDQYVGSLTDELTGLYRKALKIKSKGTAEIHRCLLTSDNCQLLQLISEKFKGVLISHLAHDDQTKNAMKTVIDQIELLLSTFF